MAGPPEARARLSQEFFGFLDQFRPGLQAAVRARVSDGYLEALQASTPAAWLPFEISVEGVSAALAELDREEAPGLWRALFVRRFTKTPLIGGLLDAWVRVFGLSISTLVKIIPRGFQGNYRNVIDMRVDETSSSRALVVGENLTPLLLEHPEYVIAWEGTALGLFDLAKVEGEVRSRLDPERARVEIELLW